VATQLAGCYIPFETKGWTQSGPGVRVIHRATKLKFQRNNWLFNNNVDKKWLNNSMVSYVKSNIEKLYKIFKESKMKNKKSFVEIIITIAIILIAGNCFGLTTYTNYQPSEISLEWGEEFVLFIFDKEQPDGTIISIETVVGGENNPEAFERWNGYTVIRDEESGYWCYARQAEDGNLESTGLPVHLYDADDLGIEKDIRMAQERALEELRMLREDIRRSFQYNFKEDNRNDTTYTCPTEASSNNPVNKIVVYVSFSDQSYPYDFPTFQHIEKFSNLKNYYSEVSYNKLHTNIEYYDYRASNRESNYITTVTSDERRERERILLFRFIRNHLGVVNYNVDINNDGAVDSITLILRGISGVDNGGYYVRSYTSNNKPTINSKTIENYIVHYENNILDHDTGLFILAHEFGHNLGFPDMFSGFGYGYRPVGPWCIMTNTLDASPVLPSMTAYLKYKYTNWFEPNEVVTIDPNVQIGNITYNIQPLMGTTQGVKAYKVKSPYQENNSSAEYLFLENRNRTTHSSIDTALPGSGLLIYRVNPDVRGNRHVSLDTPYELYLFRPESTRAMNYADGHDTLAHFPYGVGAGLGLNSFRSFTDHDDEIRAMLSDGEAFGACLEEITINPNRSISFVYYNQSLVDGNPDIYNFQDVINRVKHKGTILIDLSHDLSLIGCYIVRPTKIFSKSINIEGLFYPNDRYQLIFYEPVTLKNISGELTFKNFDVWIMKELETSNSNISFDYATLNFSGNVPQHQNNSYISGDPNNNKTYSISFVVYLAFYQKTIIDYI